MKRAVRSAAIGLGHFLMMERLKAFNAALNRAVAKLDGKDT
jgi:hypothetical protein